jgi:hypothetical protein
MIIRPKGKRSRIDHSSFYEKTGARWPAALEVRHSLDCAFALRSTRRENSLACLDFRFVCGPLMDARDPVQPGSGCITLQFHPRLKDVLINLRERFSTVPLKTVFRLQGGYAIRWYEMLQSKKYLKTFTMSVEELRQWLQITDGQLPAVKDLRKRAIDISKAELDHKADLTFVYSPTKVGKRITGWRFTVQNNRPRPVQRQLHLPSNEPEPSPEEVAKAKASLASLKARLKEEQ